MTWDLGRRSRPVYTALRDRILRGAWQPGEKLPSHTALATEFGVAPMTLRLVLTRLAHEGLVSCETGRGTFVRETSRPAVLIVDDEAPARALLHRYVVDAGYRAVEAADPAQGLVALERDPAIALVLSDVRMPAAGARTGISGRPDTAAGIGFIRTVRRRWPALPLAAVTGYPDDLADLHGTPECPILIIAKPFRRRQIGELLQLVLPRAAVS